MSVDWRGDGLSGLTEDYPYEIKFNEWGVSSSTMYYNMRMTSGIVSAVNSRAAHPEYNWLRRKSATIRREEAELGKVAITFEGVPTNTNEKNYAVSGSTSTEPIESHPDFKTIIGGVKGSPLNGAIFSDDGKFKGFSVDLGGDLNEKAGIKSYLVGSLIYSETWVRGNNPSAIEVEALGAINNPPPSGLKPSIGSRNWMLVGAEATEVGFGTKLVRKWRMSGKRRWDTDIYKQD